MQKKLYNTKTQKLIHVAYLKHVFLFMRSYFIPPVTIFLAAKPNYPKRRVNVFQQECAKPLILLGLFSVQICVLARVVNLVKEYLNRQTYKSFHYRKNNLQQRSRRLQKQALTYLYCHEYANAKYDFHDFHCFHLRNKES